jgi:hypothetical protein
MSVQLDQAQHLNHLPGAAWFAVPANQCVDALTHDFSYPDVAGCLT